MLSKQWNSNIDKGLRGGKHGSSSMIGLNEFFDQMRVTVCEQYGYSLQLFEFMKRLLSYDPNDRPSAFECVTILQQMLYESTTPSNTHNSMHSFYTASPLVSLTSFQPKITSREIKLHVLSFLSLPSLYNMMQVNRQWYQLTQDWSLWLAVCERTLGQQVQTPQFGERATTRRQPSKTMRTNNNNSSNTTATTTKHTTETLQKYLKYYFKHKRKALAKRKKSTLGKKMVHEMLPNQVDQCIRVMAQSFSNHLFVRFLFQLGMDDSDIMEELEQQLGQELSISLSHSANANVNNGGGGGDTHVSLPQQDTPMLSRSATDEINELLISRVKEEKFTNLYARRRSRSMPLALTDKQQQVLLIVTEELIRVAINHGRIYVLTNHDLYGQSAVQAVSIWQHPKPEPICFWQETRNRLRSFKVYSKLVQLVGIKTCNRLMQLLDVLHRVRLHTLQLASKQSNSAHYWLMYAVGVLPSMVHRGFGSLITQPVLRTANENGLSCYCAVVDPCNVSFFLRYGFTIKRESHVTRGKNHKHKHPYFVMQRSDDIYININ